MKNQMERRRFVAATGWRARATLVVLVASALSSSPGGAALESESQVTFTAYRNSAGLKIQDGGNWPPDTADRGSVEAYWERGAMRLVFRPGDASGFRTDVFERIDGRNTGAVLGPSVTTNLDVLGVYRAAIRDATGAPVGWLRVSVYESGAAPRIYDGSVPAVLGPEMIGSALARIDAEIDAIESHARDVYLGS